MLICKIRKIQSARIPVIYQFMFNIFNTPTNASQLQGTTIGPCPDHVTGRQPGVECPKCDFILNSARLGE